MTPGQRADDPYLTDSPTAWRVRIRVLDQQGQPAHVESATIERFRAGIARIFAAAFDAVVHAQQAERTVRGLRLQVEHREFRPGSIGLWFDALDERSRFSRLLTHASVWVETVGTLLGSASKELIAVLRGQVMQLDAPADQVLVRPIPGPGGPRSRIELSVPGAAPSRMYSDVWEWIYSDEGERARRDLVAAIAAPGVAKMDIIFYEGQESEHVLQLSSSQRLRDFAAGR